MDISRPATASSATAAALAASWQVNPGATCLLYNSIGRMAAVGPQTLLLDVCCGTGTIGLTLAKQVASRRCRRR